MAVYRTIMRNIYLNTLCGKKCRVL